MQQRASRQASLSCRICCSGPQKRPTRSMLPCRRGARPRVKIGEQHGKNASQGGHELFKIAAMRHDSRRSPSRGSCATGSGLVLQILKNDANLARPCGSLGVPPPDSRKSCTTVFRHLIGTAEAIPSCSTHLVIVPLWNDGVIPQQDAIKCPSGCLEIGAIFGEDNLIDHDVNCRIFDSDQVVRAGLFRSL
jgi:hypothetical protein